MSVLFDKNRYMTGILKSNVKQCCRSQRKLIESEEGGGGQFAVTMSQMFFIVHKMRTVCSVIMDECFHFY